MTNFAPFDAADYLDDEETIGTALLSEASLAVDWDRPEEDEAWSHLQPEAEDTGHGISDSH